MLKELAEWMAEASNLNLTIGQDLDVGEYDAASGPVFRSVITEPPGGSVETNRARIQRRPVQIFSRAQDLHSARDEANRIHAFLSGKTGYALDNGWYVAHIAALGAPSTLGKDSEGRNLYTCTYMVTVEKEI